MRRLVIAGLVAGAVATAAAFGAGGTGAAAEGQAAKPTTWRYQTTTMISGRGALGSPIETTTKGAVDARHPLSWTTTSFGDEVSFEQRQIGNITYMRQPRLADFLGIETEWVRFAHEDDGNEGSQPEIFEPEARAIANPGTAMNFIVAASNDVQDLGEETVGVGIETRHYAGTFDLTRVAPATEDDRWFLRDEVDFRRKNGLLTTSPWDVWISDGVIQRLVVTDAADGMSSRTDFYGFGEPVSVEAPPAAQVISADEFFALLQQKTKNRESADCEDGEQQTSDDSQDGWSSYSSCTVVFAYATRRSAGG